MCMSVSIEGIQNCGDMIEWPQQYYYGFTFNECELNERRM